MSVHLASNRPRSVTITFWSVIFLATWNLGRTIAIGQQLDLQRTLEIQPDPRLRLAAAILFGALFLVLAGQLGRKRPFTIKAIPATIAWYTVYETAVWLPFAQPPRNWTLWLLASLILISSSIFTRWSLRRAATTYFHYG